MSQSPLQTAWKIACRAPDEAQSLQKWLLARVDLERVVTDTVRAAPNGVEEVREHAHRLGDYFEKICVADASPESFRLVFQRWPNAGRYWKDLMVGILREVETCFERASIVPDLKGPMEVVEPRT